MASFKSLLKGLTDFEFKTLITPQVAGLVLFLAVAIAVLEYVWNSFDAFSREPGLGLLYLLILGPASVTFTALWYRVILEIAVVFFRILSMRKERAAIIRAAASGG